MVNSPLSGNQISANMQESAVKMLPKVYNPKERPWIKIENATTAELIDQIGKCPSGALTYRMEKKKEE